VTSKNKCHENTTNPPSKHSLSSILDSLVRQDGNSGLDNIPQANDEPVFKEPWEAEVFAMALLLHERGLFTWQQWADQLSSCIKDAQQNGDPDDGSTYYQHWLNALENIVVERHIGDRSQLAELYNDWNQAALSTPHGQAIELPDR